MKGLLSVCGSLALGEYLASFVPNAAEAWPVVALLALLAALFGYGLSVRGWGNVCICLLGIALFLRASTETEQLYREKPWMRGRECRRRQDAGATPAVAWKIRRDLSRRIAIGLAEKDEALDLSRAILLGERRRLSPQTRQTFVESGTVHVFAISGLHVMAIAEVLTCLLSFLFVPRRWTGLVATPFLWGYVLVIGCSPSAVRAATMATFACTSPLFWRKPDGLRSWALTFLVVHVVSPRMIADVGNVLSFAVMLAIVLTGNFTRELAKWKQTLLVTVAAWAVGVPIAAHVFGRVTPGGLLANLVLIAAARVTVVAGAVGILTSYFLEPLAAHFNNLSMLAVRAMVMVATAVARLPGSNFETSCWSIPACVAWYVAWIGAFLLVGWIVRRSQQYKFTKS